MDSLLGFLALAGFVTLICFGLYYLTRPPK